MVSWDFPFTNILLYREPHGKTPILRSIIRLTYIKFIFLWRTLSILESPLFWDLPPGWLSRQRCKTTALHKIIESLAWYPVTRNRNVFKVWKIVKRHIGKNLGQSTFATPLTHPMTSKVSLLFTAGNMRQLESMVLPLPANCTSFWSQRIV